MRSSNMKSYLGQYWISYKRKTTVNHAFRCAISLVEKYDKERVEAAMRELAQDNKLLTCVYCKEAATTWDHLIPVVEADFPNQIYNLVPACSRCNEGKIGTPFADFIKKQGMSNDEKEELIEKLNKYSSKAMKRDGLNQSGSESELLKTLSEIQAQIIDLMVKADEAISAARATPLPKKRQRRNRTES